MVKPPGTIVQGMYLKERLRRREPGQFLEVGGGSGWVSEVLWSGVDRSGN